VEAVENVRSGSGQHALGAVEVLDRDRQALHDPGLALGAAGVRGLGHFDRLIRRFGDEGVERTGGGHGRHMRFGQLS
jgi:hypothetical protein